jgi:hypothetical protein
MRYMKLMVLAVILMAMVSPAYSHSRDRGREGVNIEVISEKGFPLLSIPHQDFWKDGTYIFKKYLEARKNEKYGIVIRNMTPDRIGVVIAVDGRNIISGKQSNLENSEAMYIVNAHENGKYEGWRTASDKVHKFYFTDVADSYAMRTFGDSSSMGVIAVAIYREKGRPIPLSEQRKSENLPAAPSAESSPRSKAGAMKDQSAGTGFGEEQYSPTIKVAFVPEAKPFQKTLIKYEWHEVLCKKGILPCQQDSRNRLWDEDQYAPYPPQYPRN